MPEQFPVTVVIVTYNSAAVIRSALDSVQDALRIIVVDNASCDDTVAVIQRDYPQVEVLVNEHNAGFGVANNRALERVTTPFALLLNPDAALQPGALAELIAAAGRYPEAAILAPKITKQDGELEESFRRSWFDRQRYGNGNLLPPEGELCVDFLSGAVMLLRMSLFQSVDFFDPKIFMYFEDDDLCLRARKHGHALVLAPNATAIHLGGRSSPAEAVMMLKNRHFVWSRLYFEQKYRGSPKASWLAMLLLLRYGVQAVGYALVMKRTKQRRAKARFGAALTFVQQH